MEPKRTPFVKTGKKCPKCKGDLLSDIHKPEDFKGPLMTQKKASTFDFHTCDKCDIIFDNELNQLKEEEVSLSEMPKEVREYFEKKIKEEECQSKSRSTPKR